MPLNFERLPEAEQLERSRTFLARMRTRRTVRDFAQVPVPFELIENAIATACTAPSGANQQPWTFAVVSNLELKRRIRAAAEAEERENYAHRMSTEWRDAISHLGTDWQKPHLEHAPYLIIVFQQAYGFAPGTNPGADGDAAKVKHYYVAESVGIAVGMLLASLHQAGLATLTHTPSPMAFLREILQRPANERAYVVIPVGYPAADAQVPAITKKPLSETLIHWD
ncbi:MAG: nitroreductase family protein [Chloroflexi bacterium]|nr:nitroreductase family protein [Chloroflexota bacterium]